MTTTRTTTNGTAAGDEDLHAAFSIARSRLYGLPSGAASLARAALVAIEALVEQGRRCEAALEEHEQDLLALSAHYRTMGIEAATVARVQRLTDEISTIRQRHDQICAALKLAAGQTGGSHGR